MGLIRYLRIGVPFTEFNKASQALPIPPCGGEVVHCVL